MEARHPAIAYFSMETALNASIPTYGGGLGALVSRKWGAKALISPHAAKQTVNEMVASAT
jgi:glucan phosphorylase